MKSRIDALVHDLPGPYILSDRRWKNGPVYFRYGAFRARKDDLPGTSSLIRDDGLIVADRREPFYTPPEWIHTPRFLEEDQREENDTDFPFTIDAALHFSNGGGVYVAQTLTDDHAPKGTKVVLKEARPHAGLDANGGDAVSRLRHEAGVLDRLSGCPYVPQYYGYVKSWEHEYLVMEWIEGNVLTKNWMLLSPALKVDPTADVTEAFREWATGMVFKLDDALSDIHSRGLLLSDIHMHNIIDRKGYPVFVDFEFAHPLNSEWRGQMGAPGYTPPPTLRGTDADRWSLGVTQLQLFFPQATLASYGDPRKIESLTAEAVRQFGLDERVGSVILANTALGT